MLDLFPDNGGPAFPLTHKPDAPYPTTAQIYFGMSMRDYFAAQTLANLAGTPVAGKEGQWKPAAIAAWAYQISDAMLAERKKASE